MESLLSFSFDSVNKISNAKSIPTIDLNADLGEYPNTNLDEQIMPFISSCNIACGGHIGDEGSVRKTIRLAKKHHVAIGAHPSYPDKENFGRQILQLPSDELANSIKQQITLVSSICEEEKVPMHHVKPHGALYNQIAYDKELIKTIHGVLRDFSSVYWMGLAGSYTQEVARSNGFPFVAEAFADRRYESDGTLRSRSEADAVLQGSDVMTQVEELVVNQRVWCGEWIPIQAQSICLHGDTKGAVTLAKQIRLHLENKGIQIAPVQSY